MHLSDYFSVIGADLFVHIDAKVNADLYEPLGQRLNVHLLRTRQEIFWGGFNTVRAIVNAIEVAQSVAAYDRFALITEDSIPLVRPQILADQLALDVEWIDTHITTQDRIRQRYTDYFCFDTRATNPRAFLVGERAFTADAFSRINRMQALMVEGKAPIAEIYHGSGWWTLSAEALNIILERHRTDRRLRDSFEFSAIPEEQYFHTILGQAHLRRPTSAFMYTDFSRNPHPYVYRNQNEIRAVLGHSKHLFLRKVDLRSTEIAVFVNELIRQDCTFPP
jgi:hypothetical protein